MWPIHLTVCGVDEVAQLVDIYHRQGRGFDAVISIDDPPVPNSGYVSRIPVLPSSFCGAHWQFQCPDQNKPDPTRLIPALVDKSLGHIQRWQSTSDRPMRLLVHCLGGIVRSPALALVILYASTPDKSAEECVAHINNLCPGAAPHTSIVAYGDRRTQSHGVLRRAVHDDLMRRNRLNGTAQLNDLHL